MWYVIQTVTGKEEELVSVLHRMVPVFLYRECLFIKRKYMKRLGGEWQEKTEAMFPAYVFLDTDYLAEIFYELKKIPEFTKLLGDNEGEFVPLEKEEEKLLRGLCTETSGYLVENTKVYLDASGKVTRLEGPLEMFPERIQQINLRKRYAVIDITLHGKKKTVLLGIKLEKDKWELENR